MFRTVILLVSWLGLVGCGTATPNVKDSEAAAPSSGHASCRQLIDEGWQPPKEEAPSFFFDPETGDVTLTFVDRPDLTVNILEDPDCRSLPTVGKMLGRMNGDFRRMRVEECRAAVEQVRSGIPPVHAGVVGDMEALKAHVDAWCPKEYGERMRSQ